MSGSREKINFVPLHSVRADGSSWNTIIGPLLSKDLNVLAGPIPLASAPDDIAALWMPKLPREAGEKVDPDGDPRQARRETQPDGLRHLG
jgi:hypothetical protein